jgi:hypothetical protein
MWTLALFACIQGIPAASPPTTETEAATIPAGNTTPSIAPAAALGWHGEATLVPGVSWSGFEEQLALDDAGQVLCQYIWTATDLATALPDATDPVTADCTDASGAPCAWQMTVYLTDGANTPGLGCIEWFDVVAPAETGPYGYGWIADWRDDDGVGHGPYLLIWAHGAWLPVDPDATWNADTQLVTYFIPAG